MSLARGENSGRFGGYNSAEGKGDTFVIRVLAVFYMHQNFAPDIMFPLNISRGGCLQGLKFTPARP